MNGRSVRGEMQAPNELALRQQLQEQRLYLSAYKEAAGAKAAQKLNAKQLSEFCRELGAMLGAGVPLVRALYIMYKRDIPEKVRAVYQQLYHSLKQGAMLSEAMEAQPGVFPELLRSMYRASEANGQMELTSMKMAAHYDKAYKLNKKVRSSMTYPIILLVVTFAVLLVVFLVVLPTFFQLFEDLDTELPGITQFMLNFSVFLKNNWMWLIIGALLLVLIFRLLFQVPSVKLVRDHARLKTPVSGKLFKIIYTARFARTLASCYASGISITASLKNARDTIGNSYIESQFVALIASVRGGAPLSGAIAKIEGFDSKLAASIQIGEETGRLYDMLESTADAFDYDADIALTRLVAILEPLMIVLMAVVVGFVIVSVMLPMLSLYDTIGMMA